MYAHQLRVRREWNINRTIVNIFINKKDETRVSLD